MAFKEFCELTAYFELQHQAFRVLELSTKGSSSQQQEVFFV